MTPLRAHPVDFGSQLTPPSFALVQERLVPPKGSYSPTKLFSTRVNAANAGLQLTPDDRVVWLLSMSYHFAVSIVAYLTFGSTIILHKRAIYLGRALVEDTARQRGHGDLWQSIALRVDGTRPQRSTA